MSGGEYRAADARPEDLPELARLMAAAPLLRRYQVDHGGALASLRAAQQDGDLLLAARAAASEGSHGAIVGLAWLSFAPRVLNGAAYLRLLLVDADAQGIGVGALLLDAVEFAAHERANHVYLLATTDNVAARHFYEQRGYRHVGDLPGLVLPALDEALYHKALRAPGDRLSG